MNIKAIIPAGITEITVNGLHQWDYGRKLEIHSSSSAALIEVHFACVGMNEAVVRSCSVINGVATAAIPDRCLEQTAPITAWVYELDGDSGATTVKINLNVEPRTRPCPSQEIPEGISDKYTEAIQAMNEAVNAAAEMMDEKIAIVEQGDLTVARAVADEDGNSIPDTYVTQASANGVLLNTSILTKTQELVAAGVPGIYHFKLGGLNYEEPLKLPDGTYRSSFATVYVESSTVARVYLWSNSNTEESVWYRTYFDGTWGSWVEMISSKNVGDYVHSIMRHSITNFSKNTEYLVGTIPTGLKSANLSEVISKITMRLQFPAWGGEEGDKGPDVEMVASSALKRDSQKYELQGFWWDEDLTAVDGQDGVFANSFTHYMARALVRREGENVYIKIPDIFFRNYRGSFFKFTSAPNMVVSFKIDFLKVVTTA